MLPPDSSHQPPPRRSPSARRPIPEILRTLYAVVRHMHGERGRAREFKRALHRLQVPMVTVANDRRVLDANLGARFLLHLTLGELRRRRLDDLISPGEAVRLPGLWEQLLERGELLGFHELCTSTELGLPIVVVAVANVLPGEHLLAIAPAAWEAGELLETQAPAPSRRTGVLSGREQEVLELIATGSSLREIGEQLAISEATVRTHLRNANEKLGARNRPHAVGLALTLGLIGPERASE